MYSHCVQSSTTQSALILFPNTTISSPTDIDLKPDNETRNVVLLVHEHGILELEDPIVSNSPHEKELLPTATPPRSVGLLNLMSTAFPFALKRAPMA